MLKTCRLLAREDSKRAFFLPLGANISRREVEEEIAGSGARVSVVSGEARDEVRAAFDLALVASGTATLETGLLGTPMIILYRTSGLSYWLAKRVVSIRHIGMINILAGKRLVPEYIQEKLEPKRIAAQAEKILGSKSMRDKMRRGYKEIRQNLGRHKASVRAADQVLTVLEQRK